MFGIYCQESAALVMTSNTASGPSMQTQNNVERWLVHEGLRLKYLKEDPDTVFKVVISGPADASDIDTEVFEPAKQPGVIVIGRKCPFGTGQNVRFLNMNEAEQGRIKERIDNYCNDIGTVHRFFIDDGRAIVGVYVVLDTKDKQNQSDFSNSLRTVITTADQVKNYLRRSI